MNMIRLQPTSISLSESDIQLHLREIKIYQNLLQQGFKKEAIQRYYASRRVPDCHSSSQHPHLKHIHEPNSDWEGLILHREYPARFLNPGQNEIRPVLTIVDSEESGEAAAEANQNRDHQASQAAYPLAIPVEQESRRQDVAGSKQPGGDHVSGEPSCTGPRIVEQFSSRDTRSFAPTTVELRAQARLPSEYFLPFSRETSNIRAELSAETVEYEKLHEQGNKADDTNDSFSPPLTSNLNLPMQHRPRHSSMLHITRNAASPSSSGHSDDSFKSTVTEMPGADTPEFKKPPRMRTTTYRQRSQTYSWIQSEADELRDALESSPPGDSGSSFQRPEREFRTTQTEVRPISANKIEISTTEVRPISITRIEPSPAGTTVVKSYRQTSSSTPLRAEAEDFVPLKLPSPFSATRRVSSGQHILPSSIRNAPPSMPNREVYSRSSPNLAVSTPPRSSSIGSITRHLGSCFTSSPPQNLPSDPAKPRDPGSSPTFGPSIRALTTPSQRGRQITRDTPPRALPKTPRTQTRMQQTDGPGTVYDDQMPAHLQPRTPADLTRGFHVTDRDAAYTAPPGRTSRTPATLSQALLSPARTFEPGEESPSRRARTMRERRERELRRSAIMEEGMWRRFREMEGDIAGIRMPWNGPGPSLTNSWRHDFDADRVGEENFDEEVLIRTPRLEPRVQESVSARRGPQT